MGPSVRPFSSRLEFEFSTGFLFCCCGYCRVAGFYHAKRVHLSSVRRIRLLFTDPFFSHNTPSLARFVPRLIFFS
jgi:hypothetical protein